MEPLSKSRQIYFSHLHPDPNQAQSACIFLQALEGIKVMTAISAQQLHIEYHIEEICLQTIEEILIELGFHLDNSLIYKIKRALYYYTEETQRANLGMSSSPDSTKKIFIQNYQRRKHGCQDKRSEYWRYYL